MTNKEKILERAQKFILKGYYDKAIAEYRAAFDLDPKDYSTRLRIGDLYVKTNRNAEAVKEYAEVARANSQRGFYLKAIAVYKQVLKLDDSNLDIHYRLAELYAKQRLNADAIREYSFIINVFEKNGKTSDVMDLLKKMIEIDPENIGIRLKYADLLQKMSYDKDALVEFSWIFERLSSQGKFDKAEKIYQALYNTKPGEPLVVRGLMDLYKKRDDNVLFLKFAKSLLSIYIENDDIANAQAVCKAILEVRPNETEALNFLKRLNPPDAKAVESAPIYAASLEKELKEADVEVAPIISSPGIKFPEEQAKMEVKAVEATDDVRQVAQGSVNIFAAPETSDDEVEISIEGLEIEEVGKETSRFANPLKDEGPVKEEAKLKSIEPEQITAAEESEEGLETEVPEASSLQEETIAVDPTGSITIDIDDAGLKTFSDRESVDTPESGEGPEETFETKDTDRTVQALAGPGPDQVDTEGTEVDFEFTKKETSKAEDVGFEFIEEAVQNAETSGEAKRTELEGSPGIHKEELIPDYKLDASPAQELIIEPEKQTPVENEADRSIKDEPPGHRLDADEASTPTVEAAQEALIQRPINEDTPDKKAEPEEIQEDLSGVISELMEKMGPQAMESTSEEVEDHEDEARKDEYVDLSAELGMKEALKEMASPWTEDDSGETFDEFKTGIGKQLSKEDMETHYNLGIAYMEMELYKDAANEFKLAIKDRRLEFDCYIRLGMCAMAALNYGEAIIYYLKGLRVNGRTEEERKGMMYELGLAYEAAGKFDEARHLFDSIYSLDPDFREVASKLKGEPLPSERPLIPLDDGLIEVELL